MEENFWYAMCPVVFLGTIAKAVLFFICDSLCKKVFVSIYNFLFCRKKLSLSLKKTLQMPDEVICLRYR